MTLLDAEVLAHVMHDVDWLKRDQHGWDLCAVSSHREYYTRVAQMYADEYNSLGDSPLQRARRQ